MKIYTEDGALTKFVKGLRAQDIELIGFHFESKTNKYKRSDIPSNLTIDSTNVTCDDDRITFGGCDESEKWDEIESVIGANHFNDIRHIDTAYKEKCAIFLTPDKGDIVKHAAKLGEITGMKFIFARDSEAIQKAIDEIRSR